MTVLAEDPAGRRAGRSDGRADAAVRLEGLRKLYGEVVAVAGIDR